MIDIFKITQALYDQIRKYDDIVSEKYKVEHSEYINMDPDRTPWVGIYKGPVVYSPGSLGKHAQSWDAEITLIVVVQATHGAEGYKCSERLAKQESTVMDAVWSDPSLGGLLDMITGLSSEYSYNNEASESMYHQQSTITITARASTG